MDVWYYVNSLAGAPDDDARHIDHLRRQAVAADEAGFGAVCLTEHHMSGYNSHGNPFVFGAHLASLLQRAWIVISVAVLPAHHPVRLAEDMNLLDQLTGGRCIVGLGGGASHRELRAFGIEDEDDKQAVAQAHLETVERLLVRREDDPPTVFDTGVHRGTATGRIVPSSHRPGGPIRARAASRPDTVDWAGERGWPVFLGRRVDPTRVAEVVAAHGRALDAAGHAPAVAAQARVSSAVQQCVYVAPTDEEAVREAAPLIARLDQASRYVYATPTGRAVRPPGTRSVGGAAEPIVGSPDTVWAGLEAYRASGISNMACQFTWGGVDLSAAERSRSLFCRAVLPAVRSHTPKAAPS